MGFRQRNGFEGFGSQSSRDENLTKYDEKFTLPTDGRTFIQSGGGMQSPVQTAAPDPNESSYVFGTPAQTPADGRSAVFGERSRMFGAAESAVTPQQTAFAPTQPVPAFSGTQKLAERPLVFVLRDDSDMYVYEYPDRLEYYHRTNSGMVQVATKYRVQKG